MHPAFNRGNRVRSQGCPPPCRVVSIVTRCSRLLSGRTRCDSWTTHHQTRRAIPPRQLAANRPDDLRKASSPRGSRSEGNFFYDCRPAARTPDSKPGDVGRARPRGRAESRPPMGASRPLGESYRSCSLRVVQWLTTPRRQRGDPGSPAALTSCRRGGPRLPPRAAGCARHPAVLAPARGPSLSGSSSGRMPVYETGNDGSNPSPEAICRGSATGRGRQRAALSRPPAWPAASTAGASPRAPWRAPVS